MSSAKSELLDVLSQVKSKVQDKLGIVNLKMPQFILIGSQSVGKSRLVESCAGEEFNFCSGTIGSRRPTVLEFRNVQSCDVSRWYWKEIEGPDRDQWKQLPTEEIMLNVADAHKSLGDSVSEKPIYLKIESSKAVDMIIVDLPGYRDVAGDPAQRKLKKDIEVLNGQYMEDKNNTILCVEQCADASNFKALEKVKDKDEKLQRTILIRTKLDKYYNDLDSGNVNQWLTGQGDLPDGLMKFALSLPHWHDGQEHRPLDELRDNCADNDVKQLRDKGASEKFVPLIGFKGFRVYMEAEMERLYKASLQPVMVKLRDLQERMKEDEVMLKEELENCDPTQTLTTVRQVGKSFADCLTHVMEGSVRLDVHKFTLPDELAAFHQNAFTAGTNAEFDELPVGSMILPNNDAYLDYLKTKVCVPAYDTPLNGGAQFRRMMFEVETYLRFSEDCVDGPTKVAVLQCCGIAMNSIGWREVVQKYLCHATHIPLQRRLKYVSERLKYFFIQQKEPVLQFMTGLKGSPEEKLYSFLYSKHAFMMNSNPTIKNLCFDTFNQVVERQAAQFVDLLKSTLHATFANPWAVLKKSSTLLRPMDQLAIPEFKLDTEVRIPKEMEGRSGTERLVQKWIYDIDTDSNKIDEAVDDVHLLVLKVYAHIRSQICDQVELFADSFFKLPLMRRLEEDMSKIELSPVHALGYAARKKKVEADLAANKEASKEIKECLKVLADFTLKTSGVQDGRSRKMTT